MDPRELAGIQRSLRREHARWHRQDARRWRTPRELLRARRQRREERQRYVPPPPGTWVLPLDHPVTVAWSRVRGEPSYLQVPGLVRAFDAIGRALGKPS